MPSFAYFNNLERFRSLLIRKNYKTVDICVVVIENKLNGYTTKNTKQVLSNGTLLKNFADS